MAYYVGILDGNRDVWGVRIPDVPGCFGGGPTPEDAIADAISALSEVATDHASAGRALAAPRLAAAIISDPGTEYDAKTGETLVMLPLLLDKGRTVKANISLDAGLLEAIDAEAARRGLTRSAFLGSAAREKIAAG